MELTLEYALTFATEKHKGQTRKISNKPYIVHPIDTSKKVYEAITGLKAPEDFFKLTHLMGLEPLLEAALLHDTLEDTETTFKEILDNFGPRVANLVAGVTSDEVIIKKVGKNKYLKTKMVAMTEDALTIKLCDRLSNITDNPKEKYLKDTQELIEFILKNKLLLSAVNKSICERILFIVNEKIPSNLSEER